MPRLLDLFCGAGGAAMGYARAGFEVVGIDLIEQPNYPFTFIQADAMTYPLEGFDAIHASPPCHHYSTVTPHATRDDYPDLYAPTRDRLVSAGVPYVIENVMGAPYSHGITLCGSMFGPRPGGEWLRRHRNFETSWFIFQPACDHPPKGQPRPITVTGQCFLSVTKDVGRHSRQGTEALCRELMGIDWMSKKELTQAIPPAYTEWIGCQLLAAIKAAA